MPNEADTCRTYVLPKLQAACWEDDYISEQLVLTPGRIIPLGDTHFRREGLRPDYVLFIRRNIPIAVVEAKADYKNSADGLQQAIQYAEMLGVKFAYSTNGKGIVEHDFITGMECNVDAFPSPDELWDRLYTKSRARPSKAARFTLRCTRRWQTLSRGKTCTRNIPGISST
jgi:type I restriction enzyme R subunit